MITNRARYKQYLHVLWIRPNFYSIKTNLNIIAVTASNIRGRIMPTTASKERTHHRMRNRWSNTESKPFCHDRTEWLRLRLLLLLLLLQASRRLWSPQRGSFIGLGIPVIDLPRCFIDNFFPWVWDIGCRARRYNKFSGLCLASAPSYWSSEFVLSSILNMKWLVESPW